MEKPKITVREWHRVDKTSDKGITKVSVEGLDDWDISEAYEDMIDALIECHEYIDIECKFQDDDNMKQVVCKLKKDIEQALTKAGVKL